MRIKLLKKISELLNLPANLEFDVVEEDTVSLYPFVDTDFGYHWDKDVFEKMLKDGVVEQVN